MTATARTSIWPQSYRYEKMISWTEVLFFCWMFTVCTTFPGRRFSGASADATAAFPSSPAGSAAGRPRIYLQFRIPMNLTPKRCRSLVVSAKGFPRLTFNLSNICQTNATAPLSSLPNDQRTGQSRVVLPSVNYAAARGSNGINTDYGKRQLNTIPAKLVYALVRKDTQTRPGREGLIQQADSNNILIQNTNPTLVASNVAYTAPARESYIQTVPSQSRHQSSTLNPDVFSSSPTYVRSPAGYSSMKLTEIPRTSTGSFITARESTNNFVRNDAMSSAPLIEKQTDLRKVVSIPVLAKGGNGFAAPNGEQYIELRPLRESLQQVSIANNGVQSRSSSTQARSGPGNFVTTKGRYVPRGTSTRTFIVTQQSTSKHARNDRPTVSLAPTRQHVIETRPSMEKQTDGRKVVHSPVLEKGGAFFTGPNGEHYISLRQLRESLRQMPTANNNVLSNSSLTHARSSSGNSGTTGGSYVPRGTSIERPRQISTVTRIVKTPDSTSVTGDHLSSFPNHVGHNTDYSASTRKNYQQTGSVSDGLRGREILGTHVQSPIGTFRDGVGNFPQGRRGQLQTPLAMQRQQMLQGANNVEERYMRTNIWRDNPFPTSSGTRSDVQSSHSLARWYPSPTGLKDIRNGNAYSQSRPAGLSHSQSQPGYLSSRRHHPDIHAGPTRSQIHQPPSYFASHASSIPSQSNVWASQSSAFGTGTGSFPASISPSKDPVDSILWVVQNMKKMKAATALLCLTVPQALGLPLPLYYPMNCESYLCSGSTICRNIGEVGFCCPPQVTDLVIEVKSVMTGFGAANAEIESLSL